ncbi:MAG TPA: choice-of-anchor B family protein [Gemmatimonadales bacterium]|nr:choice-of-anchor B family protein [Gemmatimonadales bacterium]
MSRFVGTLALLVSLVTTSALTQTWADRSWSGPIIGFGTAIAVEGNELFITRTGVVPNFPMPPAERGAVIVFRQSGDGGWTEAGTLTVDEATLGDRFGTSLAVQANFLVVGAPGHGAAGAAWVFEKRGGEWTRVAMLAPPPDAVAEEFGLQVAISGQTVIVSAPSRDSSRGTVYAFRRDASGTWSGPVTVGAGAEPNDRFGRAIALSGDRLLVGVPGPVIAAPPPQAPPTALRPRPGAAVVFRAAPDGRWVEEARLSFGADSAIGFGFGVHLTDTEALIGAPGRQGAVYVFRRSGTTWTPAGKILAAQPEAGTYFGFTLARAGRTVLVGAREANQGAGRVHVFDPNGDGWREVQQLTTPKAGLGAQFGGSMAASGDLAVIGSPLNDFYEGKAIAYTRERVSGTWRERGVITDRPSSLPPLTGAERKCETGRIEAFACERVDLQSFLPVSAIGGKRGIMLNDIWGWTDPETGREYALVGRMDGTAFVDVTDPANPVYVGELPLHAGAQPNLWRDIKTYKDHAFIVADGAGPHGMQVFDLTQLRSVRTPPVTFSETAHYDRIASAHNIVINEDAGFAFPVGNSMGGETCGGALHMIDIRDPRRPTFAGCYADPSTGMQRTGYTHDAQCVTYKGPDARYHGREICFNSSETAVGIADVTDKKNPRPIAVASYPNTAYAHQGWLSEDHRYFFLDDEGDELAGTVPRTRTIIWDMSNLEEPTLLKEFLGTTAATDHNLYVRGKYMYQSNYVSGLRVIDISDPANPRETAYFDTVPTGDNVPGFAGSWSNYPYFKSGTIVLTSMREGLFVVKHRPQEQLVP